ncbi:MAG TPA: rod shape-determining protein [Anaerolineae bacterium]|nr:rod shape-determining protein [Anaerolineae bacterium]
MFEKQIGIDLGTVNVLVYLVGKGVVLQEPSVVAISTRDKKIVAVGSDAADMIGRVPESIRVYRPVRDGVIADYFVTTAMLRHFIHKAVGRNPLFRPQVMISSPKGITSVERRAVYDAAISAGAKEAYLIPEPLAAAYGVGLPIHTPTGNMIVDIGGGTTESAVVSMNDIVVWSSIRVGGNRIDQAIINYIRKKYNLIIGDQTAEQLKIQIGSALPLDDELSMEVRGRNQVTGLPKTITVTSEEVMEAMSEPLRQIVNTVKQTLGKTPPELASDIIDRGIVLTGGTAQLQNLDNLLTRETGVPCYVGDNPVAAVVIGAGKAIENLAVMQRFLPEI